VRMKSRRLAAAVARRSGHRAMGDELSGRAPAAESGYRFTYKLSKLRDAL
jgi:hypothetical protein